MDKIELYFNLGGRFMNHELIIVIDCDGKYNQLISRSIREAKVYSEVMPYYTSIEKIKEKNPKGIIFVGKPNREFDKETFEKELLKMDMPILDIDSLDLKANTTKKMLSDMLHNFIFNKCGCKGDWLMKDFAIDQIQKLKEKIGDKKVLCALSGGVDSSVAAVLIHKAVGKQLTCIFVDHGLMRKNEGDEVEEVFLREFDMNLIRVNAEEQFLSKLAGVTDPETKRKIIGEEFIRVFEAEAKKIGTVDYLVQGTIYPDVIESGTKNAAVIKSHHNVGGLPDHVDFKEIIEPLRELYKDEVREVGRAIGIPEFLVSRQPFPGPGLAIRVIGDITKEKLDILREADFIYRDEIKNVGLDKEIWQYFAVLTNLKSVGVTDEKRTYSYTIALRGVTSIDGMSADWARIPYDTLEKISNRITGEVKNINRVVYDITSKPPATIEWE